MPRKSWQNPKRSSALKRQMTIVGEPSADNVNEWKPAKITARRMTIMPNDNGTGTSVPTGVYKKVTVVEQLAAHRFENFTKAKEEDKPKPNIKLVQVKSTPNLVKPVPLMKRRVTTV